MRRRTLSTTLCFTWLKVPGGDSGLACSLFQEHGKATVFLGSTLRAPLGAQTPASSSYRNVFCFLKSLKFKPTFSNCIFSDFIYPVELLC